MSRCSKPKARQWYFDDVVVRWNGGDWHFNVIATFKPTRHLDYVIDEFSIREWNGPRNVLVGQDKQDVLKKLRCTLDNLVWSDGTPKDEACCYSEVF